MNFSLESANQIPNHLLIFEYGMKKTCQQLKTHATGYFVVGRLTVNKWRKGRDIKNEKGGGSEQMRKRERADCWTYRKLTFSQDSSSSLLAGSAASCIFHVSPLKYSSSPRIHRHLLAGEAADQAMREASPPALVMRPAALASVTSISCTVYRASIASCQPLVSGSLYLPPVCHSFLSAIHSHHSGTKLSTSFCFVGHCAPSKDKYGSASSVSME